MRYGSSTPANSAIAIINATHRLVDIFCVSLFPMQAQKRPAAWLGAQST